MQCPPVPHSTVVSPSRTPVSAGFLHNGTLSLFEHHGFERTRQIGKHHWVVARVVE